MARSYLTFQAQKEAELATLIYGLMKVNGVSQRRLASELGISQPAVCTKLREKRFTYDDLVTIFDLCGFSNEQILKVMKKEKKNE